MAPPLKSNEKAGDIQTDVTAADLAAENARLRAEIEQFKARPIPEINLAFTSATEIDAGIDEEGVQWWWHKVNLPPSGGIDISINRVPHYHGQQYKVTTDMLRVLKDCEHRCWAHEKSIHGENENAYRRPQNRQLSGGEVRR